MRLIQTWYQCQERTDTWDEDLKKLREVMEKARSPCGMLVTKMKEIEDGTFVAWLHDQSIELFRSEPFSGPED